MQEPLLTCAPDVVLALFREGLLRLSFDAGKHLPALSALARRYADRSPDFADLCLIRMSELYPQHVVATVDVADFSVYRRNGREVIPLVTPD